MSRKPKRIDFGQKSLNISLWVVGGYGELMEFTSEKELIDHLISSGKVKKLPSGAFLIEKRIKSHKKKELPAEAVSLAHKLAKNVHDKFDFIKPTEKDLERWAEDIDKIKRLDGENWKAIEYVIEWVHQDSFWCQQVRSGAALRKQMESLKVRIKSGERSEAEKKAKSKVMHYPSNNIPKQREISDEERARNLKKLAQIRKDFEERRRKKAESQS